MPPAIDITGHRYSKLTAKRLTDRRGNAGQRIWECVCDCGNETLVKQGNLQSGNTKSCGCWDLEVLLKRSTKHGHSPSGRPTPTYRSWHLMRQRCSDANHNDYQWYGAKGVKVCKRWSDFRNFLTDMGERPVGRTLDRINTYGNYTPKNCRWATAKQQANNKRRRS